MDGERVKIELTMEGRLRLANQITARLIELGYEQQEPGYEVLDLGFELDSIWPLEGEILLSQLVVLAAKLNMQIIIGDINLSPMPKS
jgi:hypothetical protein